MGCTPRSNDSKCLCVCASTPLSRGIVLYSAFHTPFFHSPVLPVSWFWSPFTRPVFFDHVVPEPFLRFTCNKMWTISVKKQKVEIMADMKSTAMALTGAHRGKMAGGRRWWWLWTSGRRKTGPIVPWRLKSSKRQHCPMTGINLPPPVTQGLNSILLNPS